METRLGISIAYLNFEFHIKIKKKFTRTKSRATTNWKNKQPRRELLQSVEASLFTFLRLPLVAIKPVNTEA